MSGYFETLGAPPSSRVYATMYAHEDGPNLDGLVVLSATVGKVFSVKGMSRKFSGDPHDLGDPQFIIWPEGPWENFRGNFNSPVGAQYVLDRGIEEARNGHPEYSFKNSYVREGVARTSELLRLPLEFALMTSYQRLNLAGAMSNGLGEHIDSLVEQLEIVNQPDTAVRERYRHAVPPSVGRYGLMVASTGYTVEVSENGHSPHSNGSNGVEIPLERSDGVVDPALAEEMSAVGVRQH